MTTWRNLITSEMEVHGLSFSDVIATTLSEEQLDSEFDAGYGSPEGCAFTLWTPLRVFFPLCYDGAESVGSAPRNPSPEACEHQGGG